MIIRAHLEVSGVVQGVGFRPFVYRLARERQLTGWVYNHAAGVTIELQGPGEEVRAFPADLREQAPALAVIDAISFELIKPLPEQDFVIRPSRAGSRATLISPDMATCQDCLADLKNPADRRYRYAFTNCTNCGPRFTIIKGLPYDRPSTTMQAFALCPDCAAEYADPTDRRFHAQPVACPACGPRLIYLDREGRELPGDPLDLAAAALDQGAILAVKGLGGFHLACDAHQGEAVRRLRQRKYRWDRPFALMLPDVERVRQYCLLSPEEEELLTSGRRPIVLLRRRAGGPVLPPEIAPGNNRLGIMLPYTPVHHLLLEGQSALVMTSGNISDEPIVYEDGAALERLGGLCDGFLTHDRPIFRRCDDSVAVLAGGRPRLLRRSRGYAPQPLPILDCGQAILACGGEQKNTFCLTRGDKAFLSQHIGDLDNIATFLGYEREIGYFCEMFNSQPQLIVADLHPAYLSTRFARDYAAPQQPRKLYVQHHHAHLASVLAEYGQYHTPALGLIFDGTGWGEDGLLWGGEVLLGDCCSYQRLAHLSPLPLAGGEAAIREPWRQAMALAWLTLGEETPAWLTASWPETWPTLLQALRAGINAPLSCGMGRLFDGVAALCGLCPQVSYEGQAAVELEQALDEEAQGCYEFDIAEPWEKETDGSLLLDWRPVVRAVISDCEQGLGLGAISARFHRGLCRLCLDICIRLRQRHGVNAVALSGGCWQNVWLLEAVSRGLEEAGFTVMSNSAVPCNDGGLSLGQAAIAAARKKRGEL